MWQCKLSCCHLEVGSRQMKHAARTGSSLYWFEQYCLACKHRFNFGFSSGSIKAKLQIWEERGRSVLPQDRSNGEYKSTGGFIHIVTLYSMRLPKASRIQVMIMVMPAEILSPNSSLFTLAYESNLISQTFIRSRRSKKLKSSDFVSCLTLTSSNDQSCYGFLK